MGHREEKNARRSVPQFGGWDQNGPDPANYTVVFTQARANRKQNKTDLTEFKRNSLGNEQEFLAAHSQHGHHQQDDSVMCLFFMYRDVVIWQLMILLVLQQKLVALMFGMGGHRFGFLQH
ncbi:unnamed protein product [Prunus armeniaca]|uniref:RIN4 pathogenic type III effector avirulence factor Avr cleavage site domain-containing protein n=1 Tax=Prunus armeniaca TaxID=36596 RepID=A0A6J5UQ58_PRUAR|nr:unnamed protein product [Prunus armeniaca]